MPDNNVADGMKNFKRTYLLILCTLATVICIIFSCKQDNIQPNNNSIIGTWNAYDNLTQMKYSFTFNTDSTMLFAKTKLDAKGNKLYDLFTKEGKFRLEPDKLTLYQTVTYINQDYDRSTSKNAYVQAGPQNMVANAGTTTTIHTYMLTDGNKLNISMECNGEYTPTCFVGIFGYVRQ